MISRPHAETFPRRVAWATAALLAVVVIWLTVTLGPFAAGAAIGALVLLGALVRYPWIGVVLLVASVSAQEFGAVPLGGQTLTLTRAMFPVAVAGYGIAVLLKREPLRGSRLIVPYGLLVLIITASTVWATSLSAAGSEAARWIIALTSFFIIVHFTVEASRRRLIAIVLVMALAGVFQATYGVTQSLLALGPESFRVGTQGSRAFGTFGQPNSYAGYLEIVFFPVFWLAVYFLTALPDRLRAYRQQRLAGFVVSRDARTSLYVHLVLTAVAGGSALIILGGVVASYSRGAWLGIAAGGLVSALVYHRRVRIAAVIAAPLVALVLMGGMSSFLPESVRERVTTGFADLRPFDASSIPITDENFAAAERMAHWQAGWRMFDDNIVAGVGAGNFNTMYDDYFVREEFRFSRGHAHNFYVHLLAEVGIIGMVAYAWLISSVLFLTVSVLRSTPTGFERMLALGAFGTIVSVGVHNVFENLHVLHLSVQVGAVWALAIAAHRRRTSGRIDTLEH